MIILVLLNDCKNFYDARITKLKPLEALTQGILASNMLITCSGLYGNSNRFSYSILMFVSIYSSLVMCSWQQFGKAIICSDAAAEAARYGFTAVDRPEGFLVLAIASLGNEITELKTPPEVSKMHLYSPFGLSLTEPIYIWFQNYCHRIHHLWRKRRLE